MLEKANIIKAIVVGIGGYYGIKFLKSSASTEEKPVSFGGNAGFPGDYVDRLPNTQQNTPASIYNVTVEAAKSPIGFLGEDAATNETKKESKSSSYRSTNFQTQSTNKAVDFSKTSATDINRFASDSSGATIDRYQQQSISPSVADERAKETKKVYVPTPNKQSKEKDKKDFSSSNPFLMRV